jgi:hypothetical protein
LSKLREFTISNFRTFTQNFSVTPQPTSPRSCRSTPIELTGDRPLCHKSPTSSQIRTPAAQRASINNADNQNCSLMIAISPLLLLAMSLNIANGIIKLAATTCEWLGKTSIGSTNQQIRPWLHCICLGCNRTHCILSI